MAVTNDHTVKAFDEDLNRLRGLISEMGGRAGQALLHSRLSMPSATPYANDVTFARRPSAHSSRP